MQFNQIDQNKSEIFIKSQGKLVIRVHMNRFQESNPLKKVYLKQKKTVKSRHRQKSIGRKRSVSIKMFADAHKTNKNQTFLIPKKLKRQISGSKTNQIFQNINTSIKTDHKRLFSAITAKISEKQLEPFLQKVHKSALEKEAPPKEFMSELSKIIYGEQGGYWLDKSFEFIEQSSILCNDECFFLEIGEF